MIRTYASPRAFRTSLETRLRESAGSGAALPRVRQLLIFERFLARVFGLFGDGVTLKGGLVLEFRLARARATKDVDLRWMGASGDMFERLREAGRQKRPNIAGDGVVYEGQRFVASCHLGDEPYGNAFGVDVGIGEPIFGSPEFVVAPARLDFIGVSPAVMRVYPIETHIAEKLHAYTLPRSGLNGRVKDLPDMALLVQIRPIERARLRAALEQTFSFRDVHRLPAALLDPPDAWDRPYTALAREHDLPWPTLVEVTAAVRAFLGPVLRGDEGVVVWQPAAWCWAG